MAEAIDREQVIDQILNPYRENADQLLKDLGLSGFPTREQVHQEIEAKLLLPPDGIPEHWLPTYQMYVRLCFIPGDPDYPFSDTGSQTFPYNLS